MAETLQVARLPIGFNGFNGSNNLSQMDIGELADATNISYEQNLIQKEAGAAKFNATTLESGADIISGIYWEPTASAAYDVVYVNGKLLRDTNTDGTFITTLKTGLSTSATTGQFVEAGNESATDNRKLFFMNGVNNVEYVDGTGVTTTALTTAAADWSGSNWPITGAVHEDRLWLAGNANDPHRVYYSSVTNHAEFVTGAGTISVFPGEGGRIRNVTSFKGYLIVFKEKAIFYINTTDPTEANWKVGRISRNVGVFNPLAVDIVDDDVFFIDQTGLLRALSTMTEYGSYATRNLFDHHDMNHWVQSNISYADLPVARLLYYPTRRELHAALPIGGSTSNNIRVVLDLTEGRLRYRLIDRDDVYSMWLRNESSVPGMAFGDGSGFVYELDQENRTKDGAYTSRLETAPTDFSDQDPSFGTRNKHAHYLELEFEAASAGTMDVDVIWDSTVYQTVTFNLEPAGAALGSFVLGTDALGASGTLKNYRKRIVGQGRRISFAFKHNGDNQNFKLASAFFGFKLADHRLQHGE